MNKTLKEKGIALQDESMTMINNLFHIASMSGSREMEEFLSNMDFGDFHSFIPSLTKRRYEGYEDSLGELLFDYEKFGFLAECSFNIPRNFSFWEDGSFRSCYNSCSFYPFYVYAESMDELLDKVMEENERMFNEEANKARKEMGITLQ